MSAAASPAPLGVEDRGAVRVLTLDRPERRNALSRDVLEGLSAALRTAATAEDVRVVVIAGRGGTFSSGVDLKDPRAGHGPPYPQVLHALAATVRSVPKPVIAAIEGYAFGAGLALALAADLRFAHPDAQLAEAYIRIGRYPGGGDAVLLPRIVGASRALRMLWSGDAVSGREALSYGLVDEVHDDPLAAALAFAATLAGKPATPLALVKRAVYELREIPLDEALAASLRLAAEQ